MPDTALAATVWTGDINSLRKIAFDLFSVVLTPGEYQEADELLSQSLKSMGISFDDIISSTTPGASIGITADSSNEILIPGTQVRIPEPGVVFVCRLGSVKVWDAIESFLLEEGDMRLASSSLFPDLKVLLPDAGNLPEIFAPAVVYDKKTMTFVAASTLKIAEKALAAGFNHHGCLIDKAAFKECMGNIDFTDGMFFIDPVLSNLVIERYEEYGEAPAAAISVLKKHFGGFWAAGGVRKTSQGLLFEARSPMKHGAALCLLLVGTTGISVPNFVQARKISRKTACIDNLRAIESAVEQCRMDGISNPTAEDIYGPENYIRVELRCPIDNARYTIDENYIPHCVHEDLGHCLPQGYDFEEDY